MTWTNERCAMTFIPFIINSAALSWGGATDYKRREIPNLVPITLLVTGLFKGPNLLLRLVLILSIAFILWLTGKIMNSTLPGGDFKLICALAFSSGLTVLSGTLLCTALGAVVISLVRHIPMKRNIPLCTYVAPAYILVSACLLIP